MPERLISGEKPLASGPLASAVEEIKPGVRLLALSQSSGPVSEALPLPVRSLVLGCVLDGEDAFDHKRAGAEFVGAAEAGDLKIESEEPSAQVALVLEAGTLERLWADEGEIPDLALWLSAGGEGFREYSSRPLGAEKRLIALQILGCPLQGLWRRLFLEGKCNELLALFLGPADSGALSAGPGSAALSAEDRRRLSRAKDILESNLASPPTLKTLSRSCGLNENKFKRGFKDMFGASVGSHVRRERMRLALGLLAGSDRSVSHVANCVGYASPSHFIEAFRREFGDTPGRLRRQLP